MRILTIDPSVKSTGLYIQNEYGGFSFCVKQKIGKSRVNFLNDLKSLFEKYEIELVFLEDYAYSANMKGSKTLSEYIGLIKYLCEEKEIEYILVPISTWKMYSAQGFPKKKATKKGIENYLNAVYIKYGRKFDTTDEADAFMMYQALWEIGKNIIKTNAAQKIYEQIEFWKKSKERHGDVICRK